IDSGGDLVWLEVEVKPAGLPFDGGTNLYRSNDGGKPVSIGGLSSGGYHWRVRAWAVGESAWVSFGGNADPGDVDVVVVAPPPAADRGSGGGGGPSCAGAASAFPWPLAFAALPILVRRGRRKLFHAAAVL